MSQQDKSFFTTFVAIMGFLVVFAFVIYFIAQSVVSDDGTADGNSQLTQIIEENIKPVGSVKVADESGASAASAGPRAGADVYNSFCMACHATGAAGAPKTGDKAAWQPRFAQGMDTLLANAVNGIRAMPPKGTCGDCSEDELKGAIAHMLNETGFKVEVAAPAAAAPAAASAADGKKVYDSACMACHATGAAGAPKTGDKAAWAPRIDQGMDTLVSHAINGIRAMPPRGACGSCSDADLKAAVEYMVGESK
ncbi:MAG: c-type cytochrome [Gammaproteobacteria bacterium]